MQTSGTITVRAPREEAFAFVSDPYRLAACIPGCSDLRETEPGKYAAVLTNKVAFMTMRFDVVVAIEDTVVNEAIDASITGTPVGLAGRLQANAKVRLSDGGDGTTIAYTVELGLTGKLGGLGQPVFRAKSDELAREFGTRLKAALDAPSSTRVGA